MDSTNANDEGIRSTGGQVHLINGGPVMWRAYKEDVVALSSMEAELICMTDTLKGEVQLNSLLEELTGCKDRGTLYEDNTKAINLSKEPGSEHRGARHIDVRYHWISECMKLGKIGEIRWISGKENLADVFTKNLGRPEFERWRDVLVRAKKM